MHVCNSTILAQLASFRAVSRCNPAQASTAATPDILFRRKHWMQRIAPEGILLAVQLDLASVELSIKKTNTSGIR
jgi:hypothetical protein